MTGLRLAFGFLVVSAGIGVVVCGVDLLECRRQPAAKAIMVTAGSGPYWRLAAEGARAAAQKHGIELQIEMPADDGSAEQQMAILNRLDAAQYDAVAVCPVDAVAHDAFINRLAGETKLLTFAADVPHSGQLFHVGVGEYSAGRRCAQAALESLPQGGEVVVLFSRGAGMALVHRLNGFHDSFEFHAGLERGKSPKWSESIELVDGQGDAAKVGDALRRALVKHPRAGCVVSLCDWGATALAQALADAGKLEEIRLISCDQSAAALAEVAGGRVYAAIAHDPYEIGYVAVNWMARLCRCGPLGLPAAGKGCVNLKPKVVRKENVALFRAHVLDAPHLPSGRELPPG